MERSSGPRHTAGSACRVVAWDERLLRSSCRLIDDLGSVSSVEGTVLRGASAVADAIDARTNVLVVVTDLLSADDVAAVRAARVADVHLPILVLYRAAGPNRVADVLTAGASEVAQFSPGHAEGLRDAMRNLDARAEAATRAAGAILADPVTGLMTRRMVLSEMHTALLHSRDARNRLALLYLDLDRFKQVNDCLGHSAGDRVLAQVGRCLHGAVADAEIEHSAIARLGGDEFIVMIGHRRAAETARRVAHRVLAHLQEPLEVGAHRAVVTPSIGLAMAEPGDRPEWWIARADQALYRAKSRGRNRLEEFDHSLRAWLQQTSEQADDLADALDRGDVGLSGCAIELASNHRLDGMLVRSTWRGGGDSSGMAVQRIADGGGFGPALAHWTVRQAIAVAADLRTRVMCPLPSCLFALPDTADQVAELLDLYGVAPGALTLLITESVLASEDSTSPTIESLRRLRVRLAVDQFGRQIGSLNPLDRWRFDAVLLDDGLVTCVAREPARAQMLGGVVDFAHALGYDVIAPALLGTADRAAVERLGVDRALVPVVDELPGRPAETPAIARVR